MKVQSKLDGMQEFLQKVNLLLLLMRQADQIERTRKAPKFKKGLFLRHMAEVDAPQKKNYMMPALCPAPPGHKDEAERLIFKAFKRLFSQKA